MRLKRFCFVLTGFLCLMTSKAFAYIPRLSPESFERLYAYAAAGNVDVITNAVSRGMYIDSVNANGDTGLCVAAKRGNRRRKDYFMLKNSFEYNVKELSIYANIFSYIDSEYNTKADIGLKYAF